MTAIGLVVLWITLTVNGMPTHVGVAFQSDFACTKGKGQMLAAYAKAEYTRVIVAECLETSRP